MAPRATVAVTTLNRRDELRTLLASAVTQTAEPEILVIDDDARFACDGVNGILVSPRRAGTRSALGL
jgi:hypothetical protein